jgi:hypothetical protein
VSRRALMAGLALAIGGLTACGPQRLEKTEADMATAVAEALARGDTGTVRLFTEVPFAFDHFYVAAPGTTGETINAALRNVDWTPEMSRGIETANDFHLFVFEVSGTLIPAKLPKSVADVAPELTGRLWGPTDGVFSVRRTESGVPMLMAPQAPQPSAPSGL